MYARTEFDVQQKIADILKEFKGIKFNDISILDARIGYAIEYLGYKRYADIVILKEDGYPLLIIETKKKYEKTGSYRAERRFHVSSEEVLGQVFSYAAILKSNGIYVPFVAAANDRQIAVFQVPEDIDKQVNWEAIAERDYRSVLSMEYIYDVLRARYAIMHRPIRFTEEFFAELLDTLTGLYAKKYSLERVRQEPSWVLIEDFRGFVDTLTPFILDAIAPDGNYRDDWRQRVTEYNQAKGYTPAPEQLSREMAYVLLNKVLFYKVLERHYGDLPKLGPLYSEGAARSVSEYLSRLRDFFELVVKVTGNFEPIFKTGIYDNIESVESEEVMKLLDWLITLVERYRIEKLGDIIGYVYEELIPAEERHRLGQFYTPKPIAELIVKWCVRSPDDKVLDPGCGSGTFLIEAYKRLAELKLRRNFSEIRYVPSDVHEQILSQLYGVDINEFPAHLTAVNLAMRNPIASCSLTNIVVEDFFNIAPGQKRLLPYRVRTAEGEKPIEMMFRNFDAVVGNPPYTRWGELPRSVQENILSRIESLLKKYELHPLEGRRGSEYNMVVFWIMHSHGFLREGGRLGMIVSDLWLQADYGIRFGRFLAEHFKIHAIIDFSPKMFMVPMIATCVILLERSDNESVRDNNDVVFAYVDPGTEPIDVNNLLDIVENRKEGKYTIGKTGRIIVRVVKQRDLRLSSSKWLSYMMGEERILLEKLASSPFVRELDELFEPVYGNTTYTILYTRRTVRTRHAGVGGEEFFYLTQAEAEQHRIPKEYLYPLIPSPRYMVYFTFTKQDWDNLRSSGSECYLFLCHEPRNQLPPSVQRYIELGETTILLLKGNRRGQPVSRSRAADERRRLRRYFYDWYDLGGVVEAPIYVTYGAQYWVRFVLSRFNCALDHRVLALIPREKVSFNETEIKALLAYLNSSFSQLQAEILGRSTGGGMLELDVKPLSEFKVLDVTSIPKDSVERLAQLFDQLEAEARRLGGADEAENVFGSELAKELTKKKVREGVTGLFDTIIREIDLKIGEILGFTEAEVEAIRAQVIEMAKRRLRRAEEARPTAISGEERIELVRPRDSRRTRQQEPDLRLDMWL